MEMATAVSAIIIVCAVAAIRVVVPQGHRRRYVPGRGTRAAIVKNTATLGATLLWVLGGGRGGGGIFVGATPGGLLDDVEFKQASWEWVQDTTAATTAWGAIGDWDVSGVKDMSYAFSVNRDAKGGSYCGWCGDAIKIKLFVGTDLAKWTTTSLTSLEYTFMFADSMNADLSGWIVTKVANMKHLFHGVPSFVGTGLGTWITTSLTALEFTFYSAGLTTVNLGNWDVSQVTSLTSTFSGGAVGSSFVGLGLEKWKTGQVTDLYNTFYNAGEMNANVGGWDVSKIYHMGKTFKNAAKFEGNGLEKWSTTSLASLSGHLALEETFYSSGLTDVNLVGWDVSKVTSLQSTFYRTSEMNANLGGWITTKITNMDSTFIYAGKFEGIGLDTWRTALVTTLRSTFASGSSMNANLGGWDTSLVTDMAYTFWKQSTFTGAGLDTWITSAVVNMGYTFASTGLTGVDLGGWDTTKVTNMQATFQYAVNFDGQGLGKWKVGSLDGLHNTFEGSGLTTVDLSGWDITKIARMDSTFRNAVKFEGNGLHLWITTSLISLENTFEGAGLTTVDIGNWDVSKVTTMSQTFFKAAQFVGTGLTKWSTGEVTTLYNTFRAAGEMNSALGGWDVRKVKCILFTFSGATKFVGGGLDKWITTSLTDLRSTFAEASSMNVGVGNWDVSKVTSLRRTFASASEMNLDLGKWDVAKVTTMGQSGWMDGTFNNAVKFAGIGIDQWKTGLVTTMEGTFWDAAEMNADIGSWDVSQVTSLKSMFRNAVKYEGNGISKWSVAKVSTSHSGSLLGGMTSTFFNAAALTSCNKRKIADAWKTNAAWVTRTYDTDWSSDTCPLTDLSFKEASWDWVQDTTAATGKWGDIAAWDVSGVVDFSYAFSKHRNKAGGSLVSNGNSVNIASFVGAGLDQWNVAKVTNMGSAFLDATSLTSCNKRKIADAWTPTSTGFTATSYGADWSGDTCPLAGLTDLSFKEASWDWVQNVATATDKWGTIGTWDVSGVADFRYAFSRHRNKAGGSYVNNGNGANIDSFVGTGLEKWVTTSVIDLGGTFSGASEMNNVDLGKWDVSKVTTMGAAGLQGTFQNAAKFTGNGIDQWKTGNVITMESTFLGTLKMNTNFGSWDVGQVTSLVFAFRNTVTFEGDGLDKWAVAKVTAGSMGMGQSGMSGTFDDATSLTSCNKRKIADAWTPINIDFAATSYAADWTGYTCTVCNNVVYDYGRWATTVLTMNRTYVTLSAWTTVTFYSNYIHIRPRPPPIYTYLYPPPGANCSDRLYIQGSVVGLGSGHHNGDDQVGCNRDLGRERGGRLCLRFFKAPGQGGRAGGRW
jgi:surface protein